MTPAVGNVGPTEGTSVTDGKRRVGSGEVSVAELTHEQLWMVCQCLESDYQPYGEADRDAAAEQGRLDCSSGCRWYHKLAGHAGFDWGVCGSPQSERRGLLTFEHQNGGRCYEVEGLDDVDV